MKHFKYISYGGPEDFIFIRCHLNDYNKALKLAERLADEKIRVFFDCADFKDEHRPDEVAGGILNAKLCVFYLSKQALEDLDFRNSINFALGKRMKVVCLREDEKEMGHGMDMQLANIRMFKDTEELYDHIINNDEYYSCRGEGQILDQRGDKGKVLALIMSALAIILALGLFIIINNRIGYYRSAEYLLGRIGDSEYLDFTSFRQDDLVYLKDKKIGFLNCADMDLNASDLIQELKIDKIDISGNVGIDVSGLCKNPNLKEVILSQDMLSQARQLSEAGKIVEISR